MSAAGWLTGAVSLAVCPRLELGLAAGMLAAMTISAVKSFAAAGKPSEAPSKGGGGKRKGKGDDKKGPGGKKPPPSEPKEDYFSRRYTNDVR